MNRRRAKPAFEPTIVDTIITAVAPALIICMISSLVFFLIIAFYRSEYSSRLMYILGLYTFATVLVARIAIESGRAHANLFGIALFAAACVAMFRFVSISGPMAAISPVINIGLLLVAWYLADRITFDCTLVDERDASIQKGLLQSLNLVDKDPQPPIESTDRIQDHSPNPKKTKQKTKKHNPGVWVLYFALLAIPLFGLGQIAIPDEAIRRQAFQYLLIYLACALTLLLMTSFVGMRRYLRQRGVEMPSEMTRLWLASGLAGIAVILIGCLVLPLPTKRGVGFAWLPFDFTSPQGLSASKWGWGNEGPQQTDNPSSPDQQDQNTITKPLREETQPANGSTQENGKGPQEPSDNGRKQSSQNGQSKSEAKSPTSDAKSVDSKASKPTSSDSKENDSKSGQNSESSESPPTNSQQSDKGSQSKTKSEQEKSNKNAKPTPKSDNDKSESQDSEQSQSDSQSKTDQEKNADNRKSEQPSRNQSTPKAEEPSSNKLEKPKSDRPQESVDRPNRPTPPPSSSTSFQLPSNLSALVKWILIAVLVGILVIYAITHPKEIAQLWNDLLRLFDGLFGGRSPKKSSDKSDDSRNGDSEQSTMRPFSSFPDPFREGSGMNPQQIVAHTFAALEAWAEERGNRRATDQTAEEFARQLAQKQPKVGTHATSAAQMLDRVMFAGWAPTSKDISSLAQLWRLMRGS